MSNKRIHDQKNITVFYDGACGLCAREIDHYKRIAPPHIFSWVDIMRDTNPFEALGYAKDDGLKALHAMDEGQAMHVGVDAFIIIWREIKR